jgi:hypothetical protein
MCGGQIFRYQTVTCFHLRLSVDSCKVPLMNNTTKGVDTEFTVAFLQYGVSHFYKVFSAEAVRMLTVGFTRESLVVTRNGIRLTHSEIFSL